MYIVVCRGSEKDAELTNVFLQLQWIVKENQDSIYEYLKTKLSDGFKKWGAHDTIQLQTYEQMAAIATGSEGDITYGPHMGNMPKNARFASIKWTGAAAAVRPSYNSVLTCTKGVNPFNVKTLAFTPNPAGEGCYPMTLTVNTIFHHSFAKLKVRKLTAKVKCTSKSKNYFAVVVLTMFIADILFPERRDRRQGHWRACCAVLEVDDRDG